MKDYKNETVSVVIPTCNRPQYLQTAIQSVLDQTVPVFEIIIVDDSSDDVQNEDVIQLFSDERIRYVKHPIRKGANVARNTGIRLSRGKFVAFLDDDDRWLPHKLEKQIPVFLKDKEIGAVYCGMTGLDLETGSIHPFKKRKFYTGWLYKKMLIQDITNGTPTYVVRREVFEEVGLFDDSLPARQDWDMWIRISEIYRISCIEEYLVYAGEHNKESIRGSDDRSLNAYKAILAKYEPQRREVGLCLNRKAKSVYYQRISAIYRQKKLFKPSMVNSFLGILTWPFYYRNYGGMIKSLSLIF
ncbi:MAG: hypothetical protein B6I30_10035 [Desulfobacteraceae bacterium 4572_187]|nr:MAG: hypothetical protein B6I30_10035 [Desulfobacteraceae bacterium 4572_187]